MDVSFGGTFVKLALPLAGSAALLFATRRRKISWDSDLGFVRPSTHLFLFWTVMWIAWIAFGEVVTRVFELAVPQFWPHMPWAIFLMRVLAIGFAGPFLEELLFRGLFLDRLRRTRLGLGNAILVTSLAWAALHWQYGFGSMALIAADGVFLGLSRVYGRSLWIPIALHVMGNLFSIYQSVTI